MSTNYVHLSDSPVTLLNGSPAWKIDSTSYNTSSRVNEREMNLLIINGQNKYSIDFSAQQPDFFVLLPTVQKMIDPFQFIQ
jgi:hypothetical protein